MESHIKNGQQRKQTLQSVDQTLNFYIAYKEGIHGKILKDLQVIGVSVR